MKTQADISRGERLKQAREWRGLTQTDVAKSLGTQQPDIARLEKGKRYSRQRALKLGRSLGRSAHELYEGPLEQEILIDDQADRHSGLARNLTNVFFNSLEEACQDRIDLVGIARGHIRLDKVILARCIEPCHNLSKAFHQCNSSWDFRAITFPLRVMQAIADQANVAGLKEGEPLLFQALDKYGHAYRYFADSTELDAATLATRHRMSNIKDSHRKDPKLLLSYGASELDFLKITAGEDVAKLRNAADFASAVVEALSKDAGPRPYYLMRSSAGLAAKTASADQMDRVLKDGEDHMHRDLGNQFELAHGLEGLAKAAADFAGRQDIDRETRKRYAGRAMDLSKQSETTLKAAQAGGARHSEYEYRALRLPIDLALSGVPELIDARGLPRNDALLEKIDQAISRVQRNGNPRAIAKLRNDRKKVFERTK